MSRDFTLSPGSGFAKADRSPFEEIQKDSDRIAKTEMVPPILESLAGPAAILNENRQVVYANRAMIEVARAANLQGILGFRLGELLGCDMVNDSLGGCGTNRECRKCGAINAVLASIDGRAVTNQATIEIERAGLERLMHFTVAATPLTREDRHYALIVLSEIDVR
jgi:hypothetical protein